MDEQGDLGEQLLAFLLEYPWLIPFYFVGLWYLVIRPLVGGGGHGVRGEDRSQEERHDLRALDSLDDSIRDFVARTYAAWCSEAAKFDWPPSLAQFAALAAKCRNLDAYIRYYVSNIAEVLSTYAKVHKLTGKPYAADEFAIRCEPRNWLLTNRSLYVLSIRDDRRVCDEFPLEDVAAYSDRNKTM